MQYLGVMRGGGTLAGGEEPMGRVEAPHGAVPDFAT